MGITERAWRTRTRSVGTHQAYRPGSDRDDLDHGFQAREVLRVAGVGGRSFDEAMASLPSKGSGSKFAMAALPGVVVAEASKTRPIHPFP
ncbi:hypothetical protein [Saccharothrix xinjiangensis]|uniref:Uncharacterized protein n=1 Tax=Saccharothrix xinjiangensis TaxID=204798 RepID=A0ABV9XYU8_9PSEU